MKRIKGMKTILALFAVSLVSCFLFTSLSFGQEMPKPGEVIDKSNYKKYTHLFPEEFLAGFENGFEGLIKPMSIKVSETKSWPFPKVYQVFSEKNRGKFTLDKDGFIVGGYDYLGFPFPGVTKDDKDFPTKLMCNYQYKYWYDDRLGPFGGWNQRKGEPITRYTGIDYNISCNNRMYEDPKPFYKTPNNLQLALIIQYLSPPSQRNFIMLLPRYLDPRKSDDSYMYLPQMRRVLRGEGGERSTPVQGSLLAPDDFEVGFDAKVFEFTYQLLREQKVLGVANDKLTVAEAEKQSKLDMPYPKDNWEVRDVYVIEIKSKNSRYPQSRKIIYMDKENLAIYYSPIWDRAGKLWKVLMGGSQKHRMPNGDDVPTMGGFLAFDLQFGMSALWLADWKVNGNGHKYVDFTPSALTKLGR
jgi:hypothetical protein